MPSQDAIIADISTLRHSANSILVGRAEEVETAIIALLARQHHLQVGPPGAAKSYLIDVLTGLIEGANQYSLLFNRQTKIEEVYGPISLNALAEEDTVRHNITDFLPNADIFFGDEVFKASTALLNSLLWLLNERKFRNDGKVITTPLVSGFFGSNEFPESDALAALYDRISFRHWVDDITDGANFTLMLKRHLNRHEIEPVVDFNDIKTAHGMVDAVRVSDKVMDTLWSLTASLRAEGVTVSSRTIANGTTSLKAAAFLAGRDEVLPADIVILEHSLWGKKDERHLVSQIVADHADPLMKEARELREAADGLAMEIRATMADQNQALRHSKAIPHKAKVAELTHSFDRLRSAMADNGIEDSPVLTNVHGTLQSCVSEVRALLSDENK